MSGRRVDRSGRVPLETLIRVACAPDPIEPVTRPRRTGLAPAVAMALGALLIALALLLAARSLLTAPASPPSSAGATATAGALSGSDLVPVDPASAPATTPAEPDGARGGADGQVAVHVAGAVVSPGVVVLAAGARVADAIDAAGGAVPEADTDQLNLARVLTDGEQVRVPRQGEETLTVSAGQGPAQPRQDGAGGPSVPGRVNLNTADATELETLPGIGPALAQRILSYRAEHGAFTSVDELTAVSGIGSARLEALRDLVVL
ncbi:ComEA family DNA-binding protein [Actinomyces sp. W5033]|uniref:ComEA family DNA-binding protein n=1 Tax=Actinomyces sp. W5033 TaxID=3446479 RepID=UPI003EE048E8